MNDSKKLIHYLCFQVTEEGQASHAHVNEILNGLRNRGWKTELFQPRHSGGKKTPIWKKLLSSFEPQWNLWNSPQKPDVIYYRAHPAALPTVLWAKIKGIPVIGEVNGTLSDVSLIYPWLKPLLSIIYLASVSCFRLSTTLITVTDGLADWLRNIVRKVPVYTVPNGANATYFHPEVERGLHFDDPYILFFGAMSPWQGIDTLIDAVNSPVWPHQVKLIFVGDGFERQRVVEAARNNNKIIYLGTKPHHQIPGIIAGSIAGVSTQNNKRGKTAKYGFSALKVYETMACGVPVIVTDFPGQGDVIRAAKAGIVVSPEDDQAIAEAVLYLYNNPDVAMSFGNNGRVAVENGHTWQHRADQTELILLKSIGISEVLPDPSQSFESI